MWNLGILNIFILKFFWHHSNNFLKRLTLPCTERFYTIYVLYKLLMLLNWKEINEYLFIFAYATDWALQAMTCRVFYAMLETKKVRSTNENCIVRMSICGVLVTRAELQSHTHGQQMHYTVVKYAHIFLPDPSS